MKKYCRAGQATDDNMAHVHCILDTHSEYIILIASPRQQWLHNPPQGYMIRTLPVSLSYFLVNAQSEI